MLVVDHEVAIVNAVRDVLEDAGLRVISAGTLIDATRELACREIDCVLLDLMLPDGSGEQLLETLASLRIAPATVLFSGDVGGSELAERYGVRRVGKPFDIDQLVDDHDRYR